MSGPRRRGATGKLVAALALAILVPFVQIAGSSLLPAPVARAEELSSDSFIEARDRLLGAVPEDPVAAAQSLVERILGEDLATANVALMELLRQAAIPIINLDGYVFAQPTDLIVGDGPMLGEFLPQLTRSVRGGDYYTITDVSDILVDSEIATTTIDAETLLEGIVTWGKLPGAPRESVVASTAVRELGLRRQEPLHPGLLPENTRVDVLQLVLLVEHLGGQAMQLDETASTQEPASWLGPAVARAQDDCRFVYDLLQLKPAKAIFGSGTDSTNADTALKDAFFAWMETKSKEAASTIKGTLKKIDYVSKGLNLIVFLTAIQLKMEADKAVTHFRHEPGDASRDIRVVATAIWEQGETLQEFRCLQGMAGIQTRANGPFPGLRVKWRLEGPETASRTAKLLRAKPGQEQEFRQTGGGGEVTNAEGQSDAYLEPPVEREPGTGSELSGVVKVYASLDKNEVPDALKIFLGNRSFITDVLKGKETIEGAKPWAKFLFDALLDISLKAIQKAMLPTRRIDLKVDYHGRDVYVIDGSVLAYLIFGAATMKVYAYTCEGLNGNWQGTMTVHSQLGEDGLPQAGAELFGQKLNPEGNVEALYQQFLDLRDDRRDVAQVLGPISLRHHVDSFAVERGQYGVVGTAEFLLEGEPFPSLVLDLQPHRRFADTPLHRDQQGKPRRGLSRNGGLLPVIGRRWLPRIAALVPIVLGILAACGSPVPPPPSGGFTSQPPGPSGASLPPGTFVASSPGPVYAPPSLAAALIPGLPPGSQVQWHGNEYLAEGHTTLDCNAFAGWLQAGDWIIDDTFRFDPSPGPTPNPDAIQLTLFALSRPGDGAVIRLGPAADGGCAGVITRVSRQDLQASGEVTATTGALSYPSTCISHHPQEVSWASAYFGDDGTHAYLKGTVPLALGDQELTEVELKIGRTERTPSEALELLMLPMIEGLDEWSREFGSYAPSAGATARASVSSIDPLVATVSLTGLQSSSGASQSITVGMRCDLLNNGLTDIANAVAATPTPAPSAAPAGHLEVQVGSIDDQVDGPEVACLFADYGGGDTRWSLTYFPPVEGGVVVQLTVPANGEPFMTVRKGDLSYAADGTGGSQLDATVNDTGSEVHFSADGQDFDGAAIHLQAECRNVTR